jgi:hypothetical protein
VFLIMEITSLFGTKPTMIHLRMNLFALYRDSDKIVMHRQTVTKPFLPNDSLLDDGITHSTGRNVALCCIKYQRCFHRQPVKGALALSYRHIRRSDTHCLGAGTVAGNNR